jgi:hypothetical protein
MPVVIPTPDGIASLPKCAASRKPTSLDHHIGAGEQGGRDRQPKCLRGVDVDNHSDSNLVGCSTGMSAGFDPRSILST